MHHYIPLCTYPNNPKTMRSSFFEKKSRTPKQPSGVHISSKETITRQLGGISQLQARHQHNSLPAKTTEPQKTLPEFMLLARKMQIEKRLGTRSGQDLVSQWKTHNTHFKSTCVWLAAKKAVNPKNIWSSKTTKKRQSWKKYFLRLSVVAVALIQFF